MTNTLQLEYDVSVFAPFYRSPTENNIGRVASHTSLIEQQGQKRKMTHEDLDLEVDVKKRKRATKSEPCYMAGDSGSIEPCGLGSPAVQAAFDLTELSNGSKEGKHCG